MGMVITKANNQICVTLDSGSNVQDFLPYIKSYSGTPSTLTYKISDTLSSQKSLNNVPGTTQNAYSLGDLILANNQN
jgi:hypothetical protein